ncbi:MAG: hypothetical protein KDI73_00630 [Candidatus Competibacteraceae bacterium]|nr:hypothetical protein [Candidatus Competibacteraceae bacterium]HRY15533.1 hypothetical protein [Candidatus Competibacteraceae bacterium]
MPLAHISTRHALGLFPHSPQVRYAPMAFNFMRGRQMIIHDPRLNNPKTSPPTPLRPPAAMNVWTVTTGDKAEHIIGWAAEVAKGKSGTDKLDALHFMAHGSIGGIQIGNDGLSWKNVDLFKKLNGYIKGAIIFFSCQVGGEQANHSASYALTFGSAVAAYAQCKVLTCKVNQIYSWTPGVNIIDFGEFENVVYVYTPKGDSKMLNYNDKSTVDLNTIIFG